ncbi:MAG: hypothetical protein WCT99_12850 [Bacteroidota bacterium]
MKGNDRFLKYNLITLIVIVALASYPLARFAGAEVITAAFGGMILSVINAAMGYAAIEISFGKSYTKFVQIVLGGIAVRLFVMVTLLLVMILVFKLRVMPLVVSLFVLYVAFLVIEVLHIHGKWQEKIQTQNSK